MANTENAEITEARSGSLERRGSTAPAWETVAKIQGDLLKEQGVLIDQLTRERDEARNNLKTASAQWAQWRKELVQ